MTCESKTKICFLGLLVERKQKKLSEFEQLEVEMDVNILYETFKRRL